MNERRCKALPDCGRPVTARGLCQSHYRLPRDQDESHPLASGGTGEGRSSSA
jgi:hypothetical protein